MTEQSPNELFQNSSFLQGHNAQYVEQLYARGGATLLGETGGCSSPAARRL